MVCSLLIPGGPHLIDDLSKKDDAQDLLIDEYRCTGTVDRSRSEDPQDHLIDKYRCTGSLDGWVKMHSIGSPWFCLLAPAGVAFVSEVGG